MRTVSIKDRSQGRWIWVIPIFLLAAMVAIVFLAPAEKTLGETIRYVYVHVAFTRSGMFGFYAAGVFGLLLAVTAWPSLGFWTRILLWVSYLFFLLGGIASVFAQQQSWGGMMLAEPRNRTTLSVLAVGIIILILSGWMPWLRLRGLSYMALAAYVAWTLPRTPLILHPANAAGSSPSAVIRLVFPLLTLLAGLLGLWLVWYLGRRGVKSSALAHPADPRTATAAAPR